MDSVNVSNYFLVVEYLEGGDIKWRDDHDRPLLNEQTARNYFRDVVSGLAYRKCSWR
jgi:SNF1-activating kinase 1